MATKHKVTKAVSLDDDGNVEYVYDDIFEYRGVEFTRRDNVAPGYWGRYQIGFGKLFTKRRDVLKWIDEQTELKGKE